MRRLKVNQRGMIVPVKEKIRTAGATVYKKPNPALRRLDDVLSGAHPNILISRTQGGIGDVLMTLPTVKAISKKYDCPVDYATDPEYLDGALVKVLKHNPYIRHVIPWRTADKDQYHAVIDLTCPCVAHERPGAPPINRIDLFARHAGVELEDTDIDYTIEPEELRWAETYLIDNNLDRYSLLLVQPSSMASPRDAPLDKIKKAMAQLLGRRKNMRAIVITHQSDSKRTDWNFSNVHVLNNYDIRHIAAIMHYCDLVLCPDSSILHLAGALKHPTVTLFGPTDARARVNYFPNTVAIWPGKDLKNYPCWYENLGDGYICWKRLEVPVIVETMIAVLDHRELPLSRDIVTFGDFDHSNQFYEIL